MTVGVDDGRVAEIRQLLQDLDDTPLDQMNALFYAHAYAELDIAVRDLLEMVDPHHDGPRAVEPAGGLAAQIHARFAGLHLDLPDRAHELPRPAPFDDEDDDTGGDPSAR